MYSSTASEFRRLTATLVAAVALLVLATLAPRMLLDPPPTEGPAALARWRAWSSGELAVTDEHAARLRAGFIETTRPDGATVLASRDPDDGACWQLVVTDGVAVGPMPDTDGGSCDG